MNETLPGASLLPDSTGTITIIHLALIALVALAAIAIMIVGRRRKRARLDAQDAFDERVAEQKEIDARQAPPPPGPAVPAPPPAAAPPARSQDDAVARDDRLADEPIAAAAPAGASPAAEAAPDPVPDPAPVAASASPAEGPVGDLKGLGPKVAARLAELGITSVGQIAALSDDEAARIDRELGPFAGRMARDRWVEQARFLAAGDRAGFEAVFGRL